MADTKISALPAATTYNTGDVFPIVQGGTTKKLDLTSIVPTGGTVGQTLKKNSSTDYDDTWITPLVKQIACTTPTGTTNTTGVMMGLGAQATPSNFSLTAPTTGRVLIIVQGTITATAAGAVAIKIYYGSTAAPANGAAVTGTVATQDISATISAANNLFPWCATTVVSGLSAATTYWVDLVIRVVGSTTGTLNLPVINIVEL